MHKPKSKSNTDFTFYIPFEWMEIIENEGILPISERDVVLDKDEFLIFGWEIGYTTENMVFNLYLFDGNEPANALGLNSDDWFMDFSINDITDGVWKHAEIGKDKIRIRCLWLV